jgi:hypothetical protein
MDRIEELLKQKMQEGWNIQIECKGKGRGYELTYEAYATYVGQTPIEKATNFRHGIGNTIEELIENTFRENVKEE